MSSTENINFLVEMGFSQEKAVQADTATSGQGLQAAIDWLLVHPDGVAGQTLGGAPEVEPVKEDAKDQNESTSENAASDSQAVAGSNSSSVTNPPPDQVLSLVCEECGKQLKSEFDAQTHAARSGHQKFAESTEAVRPLTEEEKQKQLEIVQKKMSERKKHREEIEKEEAKSREKIRRKMGKEVTDAKQKHEFSEAMKIAEERRKEKIEERIYRQKLKEKIAQDRANMKASQAASNTTEINSPPTTAAQPQPENTKTEAKEYDTCKIQFRFPNGTSKTANFKPSDLFSEVNYFASVNGYDGDSPLRLMTTFPRKTFTPGDMNMTLKDLGLVPTSVIVVAKT